MPFISFFYKLKDDNAKYYGKYCFDQISDDHSGLDIEVKYILQSGLDRYRKKHNLPSLKSNDIYVGVLSFSINDFIPTHSSDEEKCGFDFYCDYNNGITTFYVNGNKFYD